jgi:hypothetical protein
VASSVGGTALQNLLRRQGQSNARFHDTLEYDAENVGFANRSLRARENAEWSGTLSSIERSQNHR